MAPVHRGDAAVEFRGELHTFVHVDRTFDRVSGGDQCRRSLQARSLQRGFLFVGHETDLPFQSGRVMRDEDCSTVYPKSPSLARNPLVVDGDVGEVRAAGAFPDRPDAAGGRLKSFIHADIASSVQFWTRSLTPSGICQQLMSPSSRPGGLASGLAVAALTGLITSGRAWRDAGLVGFYLVAL
jgi:hypothetical protein